jgi:hypothetical protein
MTSLSTLGEYRKLLTGVVIFLKTRKISVTFLRAAGSSCMKNMTLKINFSKEPETPKQLLTANLKDTFQSDRFPWPQSSDAFVHVIVINRTVVII